MIARLLASIALLGCASAVATATGALASRHPVRATRYADRVATAVTEHALRVTVDALVDVWMEYGR